MTLKTSRCCCDCPRSIHSYVGCMAKGCGCQHGVPSCVEELHLHRYPDSFIVDLPDKFVEEWVKDHPGATRVELEDEVRGNYSAVRWQHEASAISTIPNLADIT